jgi:hypothetical protein
MKTQYIDPEAQGRHGKLTSSHTSGLHTDSETELGHSHSEIKIILKLKLQLVTQSFFVYPSTIESQRVQQHNITTKTVYAPPPRNIFTRCIM